MMCSERNTPKINQCSSCDTLLDDEWKLLKCLHGICNVCAVRQTIDSGSKCAICKTVTTNDELLKYDNISTTTERCKQINCSQEADNLCRSCFKVYCKLCSVDHSQTDNEHQQFTNLFQILRKYETIQCSDCINKPAEVSCIQCSRIYCAYCQLKYHRDHEYKKLTILNEENRCAFNDAEKIFSSNSVSIYDSMMSIEFNISKLREHHNTNVAEIREQWKKILTEMNHCKHQIEDKLQKLYEDRASELNKNKSIINELKIKNDHYLNFTLSILNLKNVSLDYRLIENLTDKRQWVKTQINNVVPELLSNKSPEFNIKNFHKSSNKIINVIRSVINIIPSSILDLTSSENENKSPLDTIETMVDHEERRLMAMAAMRSGAGRKSTEAKADVPDPVDHTDEAVKACLDGLHLYDASWKSGIAVKKIKKEVKREKREVAVDTVKGMTREMRSREKTKRIANEKSCRHDIKREAEDQGVAQWAEFQK